MPWFLLSLVLAPVLSAVLAMLLARRVLTPPAGNGWEVHLARAAVVIAELGIVLGVVAAIGEPAAAALTPRERQLNTARAPARRQPRQEEDRSACWRTQVCIAMAAAAEALIERVEPNCAIEKVPSHAERACSESPGPSWPNSRQHPPRQRERLQRLRARAGCRCPSRRDALLVQVRGELGDVGWCRTCW